MRVRYCLIMLLCLLSACFEPSAPAGPTPIELRMNDHSASMEDWRQASFGEKEHFGRLYTEAHLGSFHQQKSNDIIEYLDSAVKTLGSSMRQAGMDSKSLKSFYEKQEIWLASAAGARLMGWPDAVGDISSASDREE